MRSRGSNDTWHVKYLLGNLTEEEQAQAEDRAFADADCLSALEDTEADLIDAYVRGELTESDRRSFERRFLTSPERRSKVEFARALATITSESKTEVRPAAGRPSVRAFWRWSPAFQFASAIAVLMCIVGSGWLIHENAAIRARVAALEAERREFESKEQNLRQQLTEEQKRAAALSAQNHQPLEGAPASLIASLVLVPGLSRAQTHVEQLVLSASAQIARIEIELEPRDDYPRFRVELRTRRGDEVLSRSNLVRRKSGPGFAVSVDVPASALAAGDYELALQGITADRTTQDVGFYYFAVQRR